MVRRTRRPMHNAGVQNIPDSKRQPSAKVADAGRVLGAALALDVQQNRW